MTGPAPTAPGRPVSDVVLSFVRTYAPYAVAAVATWAGRTFHVVIPESMSTDATLWLAFGLGSGYYALARWCERRDGPGGAARVARAVGKFLLFGAVRQPVYTPPPPVVDQP